jgi:hypothetical protein
MRLVYLKINTVSYILLLLLVSCRAPIEITDWPDTLPPARVFIALYEQDEENKSLQKLENYLLWIKRFYLGYQIAPGWLEIEGAIEDYTGERWSEYCSFLEQLSIKISSEWAQDNSVRKINSRTAAIWRDALVEAMAQDKLDQFLQQFTADVEDLLSGELSTQEVRFTRYFEDDFAF